MRDHSDSAASAASGADGIDAPAIVFALRELSQTFRQHDRHLAETMRLKPMEYHAMEHILDGRGALGPIELSTRLGLAAASTTELLDRLQQLGHVLRERDESDRRRVKVAPTPEATRQILMAISPAIGDLSDVVEQFDPAEQAVILRFLTQISDTLRARSA